MNLTRLSRKFAIDNHSASGRPITKENNRVMDTVLSGKNI